MSLTDILLIAAGAYFGGIAVLLTLGLSVFVAFDKLRPEDIFEPEPADEIAASG